MYAMLHLDPWVNDRLGVPPLRFQDLHGRDIISPLMYFKLVAIV